MTWRAAHSIAFVRHPFDRLISSYSEKFVIHRNRPIDSFEKLEIFAKEFYCKAKMVDEREAIRDYRGLSFLEFVTAIEKICTGAGRGEPELDFHFNRQVPVYFVERGLVPAEIVDVEHLRHALIRINQRYGISYLPSRSNETPFVGSDRVGSTVDVSSVALARGEKVLSRAGFVSSETVALVKSAHDPDFDYCRFSDVPHWLEPFLSGSGRRRHRLPAQVGRILE